MDTCLKQPKASATQLPQLGELASKPEQLDDTRFVLLMPAAKELDRTKPEKLLCFDNANKLTEHADVGPKTRFPGLHGPNMITE